MVIDRILVTMLGKGMGAMQLPRAMQLFPFVYMAIFPKSKVIKKIINSDLSHIPKYSEILVLPHSPTDLSLGQVKLNYELGPMMSKVGW